MKGLGIYVNDILYIYNVKRSHISHEWYLSLHLGMSFFITRAPLTNKDLDRGTIVVSGKWEFGASKHEWLPRVSRIHEASSFLFFLILDVFLFPHLFF